MVLTLEFPCSQLNTQMRSFTYPKMIKYCLQCTRIFLYVMASSGVPFIRIITKVSMSRELELAPTNMRLHDVNKRLLF